MDLSFEEGVALKHHYQEHLLNHKNVYTSEDKQHFEELEHRLQRVFEANEAHAKEAKNEYFVRLSSRSPKDVGLSADHPKVLQVLFLWLSICECRVVVNLLSF